MKQVAGQSIFFLSSSTLTFFEVHLRTSFCALMRELLMTAAEEQKVGTDVENCDDLYTYLTPFGKGSRPSYSECYNVFNCVKMSWSIASKCNVQVISTYLHFLKCFVHKWCLPPMKYLCPK